MPFTCSSCPISSRCVMPMSCASSGSRKGLFSGDATRGEKTCKEIMILISVIFTKDYSPVVSVSCQKTQSCKIFFDILYECWGFFIAGGWGREQSEAAASRARIGH